jgi:hypothetical protein
MISCCLLLRGEAVRDKGTGSQKPHMYERGVEGE